jgi:hypothetical protein
MATTIPHSLFIIINDILIFYLCLTISLIKQI